MASLLTTMFVSLFSSPAASPAQAKPLPPHCTLKQSVSCVTLNSYTQHDPSALEAGLSSTKCGRVVQLLRDELRASPIRAVSPPSQQICPKIQQADLPVLEYSNARTRGQFKPQRANKGTTSYQLRQFAEATLGSGSLRKAVKLPEGEDLNEWLAVNGENFLRKKEYTSIH